LRAAIPKTGSRARQRRLVALFVVQAVGLYCLPYVITILALIWAIPSPEPMRDSAEHITAALVVAVAIVPLTLMAICWKIVPRLSGWSRKP
jgi:hypothetical protein